MAVPANCDKRVEEAVEALLKWRTKKLESEKPNLLEQDEEFLYLVVTLKKIPQKARVSPYKVPLPNPLTSPFSETCLIIDDRPKSKLTKDDVKKKLKAQNVAVSKVLKLSKLASDYRPFEAKRKLCDSYDMFFVDKRVVPLLPRLIGKKFFRKRKVPLPIDLGKRNWKEQVERACSAALVYLGTGTCCVVKVAKVSMERDEIVANVISAIVGVVDFVPKKWANVRSLHLKLLDSVALPVYQAVPDVRLKIEGCKGKGEKENAATVEKEGVAAEEASAAKVDKKKKKGRIHEVRYMDSEVGEDPIEDGSGNDSDEDDNVVAVLKDEAVNDSAKLSNKKRKKGAKAGKEAPVKLTRVQRSKKSDMERSKESGKQKNEPSPAKVRKGDSIKQSESLEKKNSKKKDGLLKSKTGDMEKKVKTKRSKKAA